MKHDSYDLAIIGAGPSGMMAAVRASECGAHVVLLEKNRIPGIKLLMTGKERCNITNAETDIRIFCSRFGENGKFLFSALYRFGVQDTIDFFHKNKLKTKTERGGRIFPESDSARDVQELFLRLLTKNNITLITNCTIKAIVPLHNTLQKIIIENGSEIKAKNFLISTGGLSYPKTGSTGDGYIWAQQIGHTMIKPEPALTPIVVREKWVKDIEGLSLKNVRISVCQNNKKQDDRFGEALFTGFGLSGPIILDMSKSIGEILTKGHTILSIDLKPGLEYNILEKRILRDLKKHSNKALKNILPELLPKKLIPIILDLSKIDPEKKGHSVTKDERKTLRKLLKDFPLTVKSLLGFNKAIITTGGINSKEIDPKTMRSKLLSNVFFAGEILDVDGPTGGYNLQVCWSTGYCAGESAAKSSFLD